MGLAFERKASSGDRCAHPLTETIDRERPSVLGVNDRYMVTVACCRLRARRRPSRARLKAATAAMPRHDWIWLEEAFDLIEAMWGRCERRNDPRGATKDRTQARDPNTQRV